MQSYWIYNKALEVPQNFVLRFLLILLWKVKWADELNLFRRQNHDTQKCIKIHPRPTSWAYNVC